MKAFRTPNQVDIPVRVIENDRTRDHHELVKNSKKLQEFDTKPIALTCPFFYTFSQNWRLQWLLCASDQKVQISGLTENQ